MAAGKTWLRGHNMRMLASAAVPDRIQEANPDPAGDTEWWDETAQDSQLPLTYEAAAELAGPDPSPARMARPGDSSVPRVTERVRKDIEGKMAFWLSMGGDLWNMADPYCAGVFADNVDKIAKKAAPLICQSPDMVRWFQRSSGFLMWTELGMAFKPVITAVIAHHVTKRVVTRKDATDSGQADDQAEQADWSAYAA